MTAAPPPADEQADNISQCPFCFCMTHSVNGRCGKCGAVDKDEQAAADELRLKRQLQLLKGSNGEYVLSTVTDLYALMDAIAAYSRTQTEAVLSRLWKQHEGLYSRPGSNADVIEAVPLVAIDAELERLRGEA